MGMKSRKSPAQQALLGMMEKGKNYSVDQLSNKTTAAWQVLHRMVRKGLVRKVNPGTFGKGAKGLYQITPKGLRSL